MEQITGALVGIALVLSAVFVPMAFFGGSVGVIYRQFSITLVVGDGAVGARRADAHARAVRDDPEAGATAPSAAASSACSTAATTRTQPRLSRARSACSCGASCAAMIVLRRRSPARSRCCSRAMPKGFLPEEDQGQFNVQVLLPPGATQEQTRAVMEQVSDHFLDAGEGRGRVGHDDHRLRLRRPRPELGHSRSSSCGTGTSATTARLKASAVVARATGAFSQIKEAHRVRVRAAGDQRARQRRPASRCSSQDRGGLGHDALIAARDQLLGLAAEAPGARRRCARAASRIAPSTRSTSTRRRPRRSACRSPTSTRRCRRRGAARTSTTSSTTAARSACTCRPTRRSACSPRISAAGTCATGPARWCRSRRSRPAAGRSARRSSIASTASRRSRSRASPRRATARARRWRRWRQLVDAAARRASAPSGPASPTRSSTSGANAPILYALSLLVVFLCLAALYESWSIPVSVMLVVPLGVLGAVVATLLGKQANDVYFQVGLLATIGLVGEERDPDRRVREGARTSRANAGRGGARGGADAPASDPDDVARVRARRAAARDRERRRCGRAERDRRRGHRRRARGDVPRRAAGAGVLRADRVATAAPKPEPVAAGPHA